MRSYPSSATWHAMDGSCSLESGAAQTHVVMPMGFMLLSRDDTLGERMRRMPVLIRRKSHNRILLEDQFHGEAGERGTTDHQNKSLRALRSRRALRETAAAVLISAGLLLATPHSQPFETLNAASATLERQQSPEASVAGLKTESSLEVKLWAAEPQLSNPSNIAVDARGRVWVLEAVNYRRQLRNEPDIRPAGDRILILDDTDRDGRADKVT